MIRVGYLDDDQDLFNDHRKRLYKKGIDLLYIEDCNTMQEILIWILNNAIECMLIDQKLIPRYSFKGTSVVAFINSELPDLPCIILTSYITESVNENLVVKNLIVNKDLLSSIDLSQIVDMITQAALVYKNRRQLRLEEYESLYEKIQNKKYSAFDQERFLQLFRILRAYGEVDNLPSELLIPSVGEKLDEVLSKLDKIIANSRNKG